MANDGDKQGSTGHDAGKQSGQSDKRRVIGEGMTSLDSTQVPLKAENGEPDWDAVKGGKPADYGDKNRPSSNR